MKLSRSKKFAFALIATALCLALVELLLALCGVRPESYSSDPYVGFSAQAPLFVEERELGGELVMTTARGKLPFFNPQRFSRSKERGVFRVFVLGGSTAYGHPYHDATSFGGWLREFLRATAPDRRWEVINAGGISYGSYRDARLMEELIRYEPDLFVLYESQNEFLERRIYTKIAHTPAVLRGLAGLAAYSRAATLAKRGWERVQPRGLGGTNSVPQLNSEPDTLLEHPEGMAAYTRDEAAREQVLAHFSFNLERMVDIARSVGAGVIFVAPASNLREVAPFKSEFREDLGAGDRERWKALYLRARGEFNDPSPTNALATLAQAAALDDRVAALHYLRARGLEKLGRFAEAKVAYERARDEDICPLRAPAAIRQRVRALAAARGVTCVDFEPLLESRCDHGLLGGQVFLDHVHPTIEGNRLLALEILKAMEKSGWVHPNGDPALIEKTTQAVLARIDPKEQALGLINLCKTLGWAGRREEAYRASVRAVELCPDLAEVRYESGLAAQWLNRTNEAAAHYQRALELQPTLANAHAGYGVILEDRGELEEAIRHYRLALQFDRPEDRERDQRSLARALQKQAAQAPSAKASSP